MKRNCSDCGKELDCSIEGQCFTDNPYSLSHPHLGGIYCRDCYSKSHPFCLVCDTPLESKWSYCPRCGKEQTNEKQE